MSRADQQGFAVVEAILVVVIIALVGFTGWFVWHSKQAADKTLNAAAKSSQSAAVAKAKQPTTFAECIASAGSKILTTSPEQCVTKAGKSFTDPTQVTPVYLVIKEWGVKIPLSSADSGAYYKVDTTSQQPSNNPTNLTVYATQIDKLTGPAGVSCKGEYIAYLIRLPSDDLRWQPSTSVDDGNVSPLYGNRTDVGGYRYAIATKKQYGPECWETSKTGDYIPDQATSQKFGDIVSAFVSDFKNITAN